MRLVGFRIQNYKIVHDTGYVKVDPRITTLVGQNESGKTSIFTALWKSFNVAGAKFDRLYDYPRSRYIEDRSQVRDVTVLEFELLDDEVRDLLAQLPREPVEAPQRITCITSYDAEQGVQQALRFTPPLTASSSSTNAHDAAQAAVTIADASTGAPESVRSALAQVERATERGLLESDGQEVIGAFLSTVDRWLETDPARAVSIADAREYLVDFLAQSAQTDLGERARAWAASALPTFIYFSDYDRLVGRIHLPTYLNRRQNADTGIRSQSVLFEWSGLDPAEILTLSRQRDADETDDAFLRRRETRDTLLDTAAFTLTGDWETWWKERRHRLHFSVEGEDLVLKVSDRHNSFPVPFEERSKGFQWFFSFYLVFLAESKRAHGGAILLLDEPGLHLHPKLQHELTSLFERIADDNQLLYTTHLPFLIDENRMERIRTVHLVGNELQTTHVSNEMRPADHRDTLSPLQSALGPSVVQTLLLGKRPVILEGITDFWFLQALNDCVDAEDGMPLLSRDTILIPAGGRSRLIPLAFVVLASSDQGRSLVLLNSSREGQDEAARMRDVFGDDVPVVLCGDLLGSEGAMIEDLVPRDVYAEAAQQGRFNSPLNEEEEAAATNVAAISQLYQRTNLGEFGKAEQARTALALTDLWNRDHASVPDSTKEKARQLVEALNRHLDRFSAPPDTRAPEVPSNLLEMS